MEGKDGGGALPRSRSISERLAQSGLMTMRSEMQKQGEKLATILKGESEEKPTVSV